MAQRALTGMVFDIKRFSSDDGPGIRTTVFLKGCPLSCAWCHSPESISAGPQLLFHESRCMGCGLCVQTCPEGAQGATPEGRSIDRSRCRDCGACAGVCPTGALAMCGRQMTAGELLEEIAADRVFYRHSGGGATISGGEPSSQPAFLEAILAGCREMGIHTTLDTNGSAPWPVYQRLLPLVDLFLLDLKQMDHEEHRRLTGVGNRRILSNAGALAESGAQLQIRVPLIPGLNDSVDNVARTAEFARSAGIRGMALLPYNPFAAAKYRWIGHPYPLEGLETQPRAYLEILRETAAARGIDIRIGG